MLGIKTIRKYFFEKILAPKASKGYFFASRGNSVWKVASGCLGKSHLPVYLYWLIPW